MPITTLPGMQENVSLAQYTTFKIGGPAKYFYVAKSEAEIIKAVEWAESEKLDFYIFGGGSNLLVSDEGFPGLIIKNENIDFEFKEGKIYAGAGLNLGYLISQCTENSLTGAEFLIGIPGTVGGAVRGNAGAWGRGMGEIVGSVKIFDGKKIRDLNSHACHFAYRDSLIKRRGHIILSIVFVLQKGVKEEITERISEYLKKRSLSQQPKEPSAGCVFKNIDLKKVDLKKAQKALDVDDEEFQEVTKHDKLPVGFVIDHLGLKGKKIGGAEVFPAHCNFIVNTGGATASDIIQLISLIKQRVRNKIGVQLEEETQYLGF